MPLGDRIYTFLALPPATFHGLPGLLADSLPDRFGSAVVDAWLSTQGRSPESFNAVERLCYAGNRGMGALAHLDYNQRGAHAYEQAMLTIRQLGLPAGSVEEIFRRMAFNIVARNQDDHVKNVAFLMDKRGAWALAPAFDVIYSYNASGPWTAIHQMTMNGKRDGFTMADFRACGRSALLPPRARRRPRQSGP
jgi:serine/threonine protein kinase HipA of HipAB toxin-antitoxin module